MKSITYMYYVTLRVLLCLLLKSAFFEWNTDKLHYCEALTIKEPDFIKPAACYILSQQSHMLNNVRYKYDGSCLKFIIRTNKEFYYVY
jgi:hypothetical protein